MNVATRGNSPELCYVACPDCETANEVVMVTLTDDGNMFYVASCQECCETLLVPVELSEDEFKTWWLGGMLMFSVEEP